MAEIVNVSCGFKKYTKKKSGKYNFDARMPTYQKKFQSFIYFQFQSGINRQR